MNGRNLTAAAVDALDARKTLHDLRNQYQRTVAAIDVAVRRLIVAGHLEAAEIVREETEPTFPKQPGGGVTWNR